MRRSTPRGKRPNDASDEEQRLPRSRGTCRQPSLLSSLLVYPRRSPKDRTLTAARHRGEPLSDEVKAFKPTVILAADCVYYEPAFPLLISTLSDLLQLNPSATVYFCLKKRRRADTQFIAKARKMFDMRAAEDEEQGVFGREELFLYTIRSRRADENSDIHT